MKESNDSNYFCALARINVNEHVERKGQFSYLSWPYAVTQLRQFDPMATWEVRRFADLPYLCSEAGCFVEVAVKVQGVTLSQIHPVLDAKNRPIVVPNAFDINTSIQRCLVKAIALHGLGLYIYAGEDLPAVGEETRADEAPPVTPATPVTSIPATAGGLDVAQVTTIRAALVDSGSDEQRLLDYFGVATLEEIPATNYPRVMRSIQNARRAA